ncbi:MAG: hypothetical protein AAGF20_12045 [Pseudomonadota bacterium]
MPEQTYRSARRRYVRLFWPLMLLYILIILGGSFGLGQFETEPKWLQAMLAILAALPVIAVLIVMLRYFEETDEYSRLQQLRAFAMGATVTVSAIFLVGFLQLFDIIGKVEVFWFGPVFFLSYGIAYRVRGGEDCT